MFASGKTVALQKIKRIFKTVCEGVKDLHRRGIAHLDLKPENILLDASQNAFICDFGCSYVFEAEQPNSPSAKSRLSRKLRKKVLCRRTCNEQLD